MKKNANNKIIREKRMLPFFFLLMILTLCFFLYFQVSNCYSQTIKNSLILTVKPSTYVNFAGDFINGTVGSSHGTINNEGSIKVTGNWTNNATDGTNVVFTNLNSDGTVEFAGTTSLQSIGGSRPTTFENLTVNNSAGLVIGRDIGINYTLLMSSGDFDLRDYNVNLSSTGSVSDEASNKRIKATDGSTDGRGAGTIYTNQTLSIGTYTNIAGLGINLITATNFGPSTIKRGHLRQQGTDDYSSNYSIYRYYEIIPTGKTANYGTVTINYFPTVELNGHTDGQLVMFQSVNMGGPTYWTPLATTNTSPQAVATTITNNLASIKVTCGSASVPLPIELIDFKANCNGNNVELSWSTTSETNNDYFIVERSTDSRHWKTIATIVGAGNSSQTMHYSYPDDNISGEGAYYYRLISTDFDGTLNYSDVVPASCNDQNNGVMSIFPNPVKDELHFLINIQENTEAYVSVVDILGRELLIHKQIFEKGKNNFSMDISKLNSGVYHVRVEFIKGLLISKKIVVDR